MQQNLNLDQAIVKLLDEYQAEHIETLDVRDATTLVDHIIFCTAKNPRHSRSLAEKVIAMVKKNDTFPSRAKAEGLEDGSWVLIDADLCMVHIMLNDIRDHYSIEKLWRGLIAKANHHED